jgi:hypothetical protein
MIGTNRVPHLHERTAITSVDFLVTLPSDMSFYLAHFVSIRRDLHVLSLSVAVFDPVIRRAYELLTQRRDVNKQ